MQNRWRQPYSAGKSRQRVRVLVVRRGWVGTGLGTGFAELVVACALLVVLAAALGSAGALAVADSLTVALAAGAVVAAVSGPEEAAVVAGSLLGFGVQAVSSMSQAVATNAAPANVASTAILLGRCAIANHDAIEAPQALRLHTVQVAFATLRSQDVVSFGVMYVSAALKRAGHEVELLVAEDAEELVALLRRRPTQLLAFSVTTGLHGTYLAWAAAAKRAFRLRTVFGGPHPTFFPEMIEQPQVDAIVIGEGEHSCVELIEAFEADDGRPVAGVSYRHGDGIVRGPLRPPEQDLDCLPLPDRALFFDRNPFHESFPVRSLLAARGWPYRCSYCFNRTLLDMYRGKGKAVRYRQPAAVVAEIQQVRRRWPMSLVWFLDANFVVKRSWVDEICERLARDVRLPFYCKVRPNLVDERLARTLARGGCSGVGMGIEAGDDALRSEVLDRQVSRAQIINASRLLRGAGIKVMSFNMVGLVGESYEMAKRTVDLNIEAGVDYAMTMVFQPYPRTFLTDQAIAQGLFDGDFDQLEDNYYSSTPLDQFAPEERLRIENLQRLFALAVEFPDVRRNLDWLVERRAAGLYDRAFELWHEHCFYRRFYGQSPHGSVRRFEAAVASIRALAGRMG